MLQERVLMERCTSVLEEKCS